LASCFVNSVLQMTKFSPSANSNILEPSAFLEPYPIPLFKHLKYSKNRLLAGAVPQTPLGELTVLTESQTP